MDGYSVYNQISIAPEDHHKTAFITPWGTFIYVVMPFGHCNAPSAFQRAMSFAFSDLLHKSMTVFIDDFSTHSLATEHLHWVRECLIRCRRTGIAVNLDKLYLAVKKGILLGCSAPLLEECPQHHGHKGDPGVTPGTCGTIGERAQVILV